MTMEYTTLGRTDIRVSRICLGTMTWGQQNTEAEAHQQLDAALDAGINFIDTAEMYPVPPKAETYTATETIIGNWLAARGNRDKVILATKVAGRAPDMSYIRGGPCLDRKNVEAALDASLKRLKTDYVDLYQLHWPDRTNNRFGKLSYTHVPDETPVPIEETLTVLGDAVKAGKVRTVGLSNETPWGVMRFLAAAETLGLPRIVSIQNPYSLLNRSFEIGLAEIAHREDVGLLAYSPLGFGVLSGKYLNGARPETGRITMFERFRRYTNPQVEAATQEYVALAREKGLDPAQMALAYINSRPFLTSNIIGATTMEQLTSNIGSIEVKLGDDVIEAIDAIHARHTIPAP